MIKSSPASAETRKVAVLITAKLSKAELTAVRDAVEGAGATIELIASGLSGPGVKSIKSTPSVVYDGVIVLSAPEDYVDPEDAGNALKFVAQAFKHLKTIGGNAKGKEPGV